MEPLVTLDEIKAARERIKSAARYTPLLEVPWPAASPQARKPASPLYLKCENLQPMGAFKIRGAFNMIAQLPKENLERGVITYSSGNHGQAVAMAAQRGRRAGGDRHADDRAAGEDRRLQVIRRRSDHGGDDVARSAEARREGGGRARTHDRAAVRSPADHHRPGRRWASRYSSSAPTSAPSSSRSAAAAWRRASPQRSSCRSLPCASSRWSLKARRRCRSRSRPAIRSRLPFSKSIADGLMNLRPGDITFAHIRAFVDEVVTVSEGAIATNVAWLFRQFAIGRRAERRGDHRGRCTWPRRYRHE